MNVITYILLLLLLLPYYLHVMDSIVIIIVTWFYINGANLTIFAAFDSNALLF